MNQYTDEDFNRDDWGMIQDAIIEHISYLKHRPCYGYEEQVERLEAILKRASFKYAIAPKE